MPPIRLQKILSAAGVASRRHAEGLILEGRVSVNGHVVRELGTRADPDRDEVRVDGARVTIAKRRRYVLMNKPRGYVTTRSDPQGRPTVLELLQPQKHQANRLRQATPTHPTTRASWGPRATRLTRWGPRQGYGGPPKRDAKAEASSHEEYLYPVGRLDYDSEGLLLLTNDGDLAARLMHPRHEIDREYHVRVRGIPDARTLSRLARGIVLEGRRTAPAGVRLIDRNRGSREDQSVLALVLREGRSRQVRNMCAAVGHPVVRLRRVRIGPLRDPSLKIGAHRELTRDEVNLLKKAARS